MAILQKIDSNVTGLRYAEEASLGVLPGDPNWVPMEPNSYSNFGGQLTTVAREPINATRQRRKGVVTDLAVAGSVNSDLTQLNMQDLLQGYFFADLRRKYEHVASAVVNSGSKYDVASTAGVVVGALALATGFGVAANNQLVTVASFIADTSITVTQTTTDEASPPSDNKFVVVGHQFQSGTLNVVGGGIPELVSTAAKAANTLTIALDTSINGQTVTIGGKVYTFRSAATPTTANDVHFTTASDAMTNLVAAVNRTGTPGTQYGANTLVNADVSGSDSGGGVGVFTAKVSGVAGDKLAATETLTDSGNVWTDTGGFLIGGTGTSFLSLGLVAGEWIWIGNTTGSEFVTAANSGFARIHSIADLVLTLDKTAGLFVTETGTSLTVQIFFGRVLKNESDPTLIKRRTYQLERTLGAPDDSQLTEIQAEYLVGSVPNTFKFNFTTAQKITVDLDFVGIDNEQVSNTDGLKSGERPDLVSADAYNTSSDFARLKMAILDPVSSHPSALFAFLSDLTVTIDNKLTPNKAISVLGAFEVTAGFFNVDATATAYFSEVAAVQAVRNNADVTIDFALVKDETVSGLTVAQGMILDIPLTALGDGRLNVALNKPIDLALTIPAAGDRVFNHTMLMSFFDYLPAVALPA